PKDKAFGRPGDEESTLGRLFPAINRRATIGMSVQDSNASAINQPYSKAYASPDSLKGQTELACIVLLFNQN
ncbi:MAG: hypothetical protein WBG50_15305, partial [Desulfomonilaceae bacterium]